tara:strand:+ start:507 stop:947 length:441 start_codon:yes stop_codon:yes gene_type:complete
MPITITRTVTDEEISFMTHNQEGFSKGTEEELRAELTRRMSHYIDHKVKQCCNRLVQDCAHMIDGRTPTDVTEACRLIQAAPEYRNGDQRRADEKVKQAEFEAAAFPAKIAIYREAGNEAKALEGEALLSKAEAEVVALQKAADEA